jgi:UDP-glucose 4-epimerase
LIDKDLYRSGHILQSINMAKKTVLITGASGFVGGPLVDQLLNAGYSVRAATRGAAPFPDAVDVVIIPDLMNMIDWKPALTGADFVIHLAGVAHTNTREAAADTFDRVNRLATENLVRAAKEAGLERFIFISSVRAQAGPSASSVIRESDTSLPTNDYGRSKLAAEFAVRASGVPFTIFRPVAIYGPHPKGNIRSLVRLALSLFPIPFLGLAGRRSIIGIDNFISALLFALNNPATAGETYLIADQDSYTLAAVVAMLRKAAGRRPGMFKIPSVVFRFVLLLLNRPELWARLGEDLVVDTAKLQIFGWRPVKDTYDGMLAMMRAESEKRNQPSPKR